MEDLSRLKDAFQNFTLASKSLETYYERLQEKVKHLTVEVEEKNRELKSALAETEEAKDYLKGILQGIREAIIVLDNNNLITMMNRSAEELFGLESHLTVGMPFDSLNFSMDKDGRDTILIANGKRYNVIISYSEIKDANEMPRGQVMLIQDITRMKDLELQAERNHRLIAMGEMAAKIVHEIRSPLCSIELYASMLAKDLQGSEHIRLASGISTGIKSLNNILTNMLYFARPHKPLLRVVNLVDVLMESIHMLMPMIELRGIKLLERFSSDAEINGDGELLKQVFLNILINAIQVSGEGKKIETEIKRDNGFVMVSISDEGEGIDSENLERIFDPFFSTKEKGTGLGLAIASRIMQFHKGAIKVKSGKEKGSCFELHFPKNSKGA